MLYAPWSHRTEDTAPGRKELPLGGETRCRIGGKSTLRPAPGPIGLCRPQSPAPCPFLSHDPTLFPLLEGDLSRLLWASCPPFVHLYQKTLQLFRMNKPLNVHAYLFDPLDSLNGLLDPSPEGVSQRTNHR